jgi:hypothetical protein
MKINPQRHLELPWRVHGLAADFELLDVWELPIDDAPNLGRLFDLIKGADGDSSGIASALVRLRSMLGRWFGWDREVARAIPGCVETSVSERLSEEDRERSLVAPGTVEVHALGRLRHVYRLEQEALLEISNATIHALLHLSWARASRPRLAIYIKSRGVMSRIYMAMISPFRHLFVYPALVARVSEGWRATAGAERMSA